LQHVSARLKSHYLKIQDTKKDIITYATLKYSFFVQFKSHLLECYGFSVSRN